MIQPIPRISYTQFHDGKWCEICNKVRYTTVCTVCHKKTKPLRRG